jgi:hypothetical protein
MKSILAAVFGLFILSLGFAPDAAAFCGLSCMKHKISHAAHEAITATKSAANKAEKARKKAEAEEESARRKSEQAATAAEKKSAGEAYEAAKKAHEAAKAAEEKVKDEAEKAAVAAKKAEEEEEAAAQKEANEIKANSVAAAEKTAAGLTKAADGVAKMAVKSYDVVKSELEKGCSLADKLQKKSDDLNEAISSRSAGQMNKAAEKMGVKVPGGKTDENTLEAALKQEVASDNPTLHTAEIACHVSFTNYQKDLALENQQYDLYCGPNTPIGQEKKMEGEIEAALAHPTLTGEEAVAKKFGIPLPHSHEDQQLEIEANKVAIAAFMNAACPAPVKAANKACSTAQRLQEQQNLSGLYRSVKG